MTTAPKLTVKEVTAARWADFDRFFSARGAPSYCWCMAWRDTPDGIRRAGHAGRKAALKHRVDEGTPIGLLGYADGEPVAWCSVAPRETFRALRDRKDDLTGESGVWSIVCFFIARPWRKLGLAPVMLAAAVKHARKRGAKLVEAYPVDEDSPSYRFMGFVPMYERQGFVEIARAGTRRHVMQLEPAGRAR